MYNGTQTDFYVIQMTMVETSRYDDIYLRPYTTDYNGTLGNEFMMATDEGTNTSHTALADVANEFLRPSSVATAVAEITNGFGEKRFAFMLEIGEQGGSQLTGGTRYVLTGYTDHLGAVNTSNGQAIDPNMNLYINNSIVLRDTLCLGSHGQEMRTNIASNKHILHGGMPGGFGHYGSGARFMLRPEDLFTNLDMQDNAVLAMYPESSISDARSRVSGVHQTSRSYESRPHYLSKTITAYNTVNSEGDMYDNDHSDAQIWNRARDWTREEPISKNRFFALLMHRGSAFRNAGSVTWREMNEILPNLDAETNVIMAGRAQQSSYYVPGQGESWQGSNVETLAVSIVQQFTPAIMTDSLLRGISLMATNNTIGGMDDVCITGVKEFTKGVDMSSYLQYFTERFKREVLNDVSHHGQVQYELELRLDLTTESWYSISIDGGPRIEYCAPTFCDALYAPVVTSDGHDIEAMASDVSTLLTNLSGDLSRMAADRRPIQPSLRGLPEGLPPQVPTRDPFDGQL